MGRGTVVFIDDVRLSVERFIHSMQSSGWDVRYFSNPLEGCDSVLNSPPDLLILDLTMPHMDGLELLKNLRTHFSQSELPVIILSSKRSELDIEMALLHGADLYVNKSSLTEEFNTMVSKLLAMAEGLRKRE